MVPSHEASSMQAALLSLWRAKIYKTLPLPAIVVCGDQSSGKSSVLEALTTLKFPTGDTMCTKFVTRVEMEYSEEAFTQAAIEPSEQRSPKERADLAAWVQTDTDLSRFGDLVVAAGNKMGTALHEGFMRDTLIIQVRGPDVPFFTLVDLPGLIQSTRDNQDESDIGHIGKVVREFMLNERMIVLVVVSAANDLENQGILKLALECDPHGKRTLGVITKPDSCHERPAVQAQALKLLKNEGASKYQWKQHGWHVLKNRNARQSSMTFKERNEAEAEFLAQHPWSEVPAERRGASQLTARLADVLLKTFIKLTPTLIEDIKQQIRGWQDEIESLASTVPGVTDPVEDINQRLSQVRSLVLSRLTSPHKNAFARCLENVALEFFDNLYAHGHRYNFDQESLVAEPRRPRSEGAAHGDWDLIAPRPVRELHDIAVEVVTAIDANAGQLTTSMYDQVYQHQVSNWPRLFTQYVQKIKALVEGHVSDACSQAFPPQILDGVIASFVTPQANALAATLQSKILTITKTPPPNNRLMTDAMARAWQAQARRSLAARFKTVFKTNAKASDPSTLIEREFEYLIKKVTKDAFNVAEFTARQAVAVAQSMYIDQVDEVKPAWNSRLILKEIETWVQRLTQQVMSRLTKEKAREIYGGTDSNNARVAEIESEMAIYGSCLAELEALQRRQATTAPRDARRTRPGVEVPR